MGKFSSHVISLFSKRAAHGQGGLLDGKDPTIPSDTDPFRLWVIQLGVIIATASLLSVVLRRIRQPKVIAEVLGGILLGQTAFGQIPGFTRHIFPEEAKGYLSLTANIGLCLFLFLVGLEIDGSVIKRNVRLSATVGLAGMVLPFGLGVGLAVPLYREFIDSDSVKFTHFMLFAGVAFSITAFPVLCRILTELKLLDTTVGVVVLSAGVANDIIGWTLLALSVALVNAGTGLTALYVLLVCVGWTLIVLFPIKYILRWLGKKTGSIESGHPTMVYMTIIILSVFASSFFTDIIGVHAIFGAFLIGLVVPREGGLAIALTEKLEDMVGIIFLPLYFTLSGLSTDLTLLNDGKSWGYTIAICSLAFTGKFGGCTLAARYLTRPSNFSWRESAAIGSLMSCKGLVELIVLNVGLDAGILSRKVFSMFVLEALVLTFMTTPLVVNFYPPDKRVRASAVGANFNNVSDGGEAGGKRESKEITKPTEIEDLRRWTRYAVVLDNMEHLPSLMAFTQLVKPSSSPSRRESTSSSSSSSSSSSPQESHRRAILHPLRLLPLSDRLLSSALHLSSHYTDPVLMVYRMFTRLLPWSEADIHEPRIEVIDTGGDERATCVVDHAVASTMDGAEDGRTMIMLGWLPPAPPHHQTPGPTSLAQTPRSVSYNPFDALFRTQGHGEEGGSGGDDARETTMYAHFVRGVFNKAGKNRFDTGLYIELAHSRGRVDVMSGRGSEEETQIYLPFFGSPDDRMALEFVVQLCERRGVRAEVVWIKVGDVQMAEEGDSSKEGDALAANLATVASAKSVRTTVGSPFPDTVYPSMTHETRMQSVTADGVVWGQYATNTAASSMITFRELHVEAGKALRGMLEDIRGSVFRGRRIVVTGRSRRLAVENHAKELKEAFHHAERDVRKTVGDVASALMSRGSSMGLDGLVVVQTSCEDL